MNDIEATIAMSFRLLEQTLAQALLIVPIDRAEELVARLPMCPPDAQRLILSELIKLDMSKACELGEYRQLDFYQSALEQVFEEHPVSLDLVLEEVRVAKQLGQPIDPAQLARRFPHLASVLADCLSFETKVTTNVGSRPPDFDEGRSIDDFQIIRCVGRGAFAGVYLARQLSMGRLVALKVSTYRSDESLVLSQLDHPNVVRIYDQRLLTNPSILMLYMEYVPGGTLADVVATIVGHPINQLTGKRLLDAVDSSLVEALQLVPEYSPTREMLYGLDWPRVAAWIGIQLAEGLASAHRRGIMHRDVKPANILLTAEGTPKLADFNVSFAGAIHGSGASAHFGGSLAYMSPEQLEVANPAGRFKAEDLDARSDIFSLAMVLWELWQGRRPVPATYAVDSWQSSIQMQIELRRAEPVLAAPIKSSAERVLEKTLRRALAHDREERPSSAREFAGGLRLALHSKAAEYFEPIAGTWRAIVLRLPVLLVTAIIVFIPNGIAGAINYQFNHAWIARDHSEILKTFVTISIWINSIAFPLGAFCLLWMAWPVQSGLRSARQRQTIHESALDAAWNLGHRSALIGGLLWIVAGIAFPLALNWLSSGISGLESLQFFLSLVICGGFAWIYPFFGISLVSALIYYPAMIAPKMHDAAFKQRQQQLRKRATIYLGWAAAIPLAALGLLTLTLRAGAVGSDFLLVVVGLTGIALPAAFFAHQRLLESTKILSSILNDPV